MQTVDPNVVELDCECPHCPEGCTIFLFRAPPSAIENMKVDSEQTHFACPRGHLLSWRHVRSTSAVDTAGYSVLPGLEAMVESCAKDATAQAQADALALLLELYHVNQLGAFDISLTEADQTELDCLDDEHWNRPDAEREAIVKRVIQFARERKA